LRAREDNCKSAMRGFFASLRMTAWMVEALLMPVHLSAEVLAGRFMHWRGDRREVCRDMVFEAVFADVAEQVLHVWDLDAARAAEGVQRSYQSWDPSTSALAIKLRVPALRTAA
jgi:hypothetical protein